VVGGVLIGRRSDGTVAHFERTPFVDEIALRYCTRTVPLGELQTIIKK